MNNNVTLQPHCCLKCGGLMEVSVHKDKKNDCYKATLTCSNCGYEFSSRVPIKDNIKEDNLKIALIEIWNSMQ